MSELVEDYTQVSWANSWRAMRVNDGFLFGINKNTGHVNCGDPEEELWVLEKCIDNPLVQPNAALKNLMGDAYDRLNWVMIMKPRKLETALRWLHKKSEEGMTVRLRNIKTGEAIPGEIICD